MPSKIWYKPIAEFGTVELCEALAAVKRELPETADRMRRRLATVFDDALPLFVELAWVSPRRFEELARGLQDRGLSALLQRFDADFEGRGDTDDAAWFPAWLLTDQPRLSELLVAARTSRGSPAERGWQLMMTLLSLERQGRHAELIDHRRRLKGLHEGLYRAYMKSR
jgi:hypothetical protein